MAGIGFEFDRAAKIRDRRCRAALHHVRVDFNRHGSGQEEGGDNRQHADK